MSRFIADELGCSFFKTECRWGFVTSEAFPPLVTALYTHSFS